MINKLIIKYSILQDDLFDLYFMDFYNNILSSSLSLDANTLIEEVSDHYENNGSLQTVHFFTTTNVNLNKN